MSIFFKYNFSSILIKKNKINNKVVYLEKYTKPYKTPLHLTLLLLVFLFWDINIYFVGTIKPLLTINVFSNKLNHYLLSTNILIN